MTEDVGASSAPEPVVIEAPQVEATPEPTPEPSERSRNNSEAISRALEKALKPKADAPLADTPKAEEAPTDGPNRGPDGKFAPKLTDAPQVEAQPEAPKVEVEPAPSRFVAEAKADWEKTPASVRAEFLRAERNFENGRQKYEATFTPLRPFLEHYGSAENMAQYMNGIASFEQGLRQDPARGVVSILQSLGVDPREVAAQIAGQPAPEKDAVIEGLKAELAGLKQQVGTVHQTFEQQRQQTVTQSVQAFAKAHPRFDELSGDIAQMLKTGFATDLQDAYAKAERLNPAPVLQAAPVQHQQPAPQAPAQRRMADLSIDGAPGANPAPGGSKNNAEAIARALKRVGMTG